MGNSMTRAFRSSSSANPRNNSNDNSNNNSTPRHTRSTPSLNNSSFRSSRSVKAMIISERERIINEADTLCKTLALPESVEDEDAPECPICFLNYLRINRVTCCEGTMCTVCYMEFVKSALPSLENINNEEGNNNHNKRACPFCNVENFGIVIQGEMLTKEKREELLSNSAEKRKSAPEKEVYYTPTSTVQDRLELQREISKNMGLDDESSSNRFNQRSCSSSSSHLRRSNRNNYDISNRRRSRSSYSSSSDGNNYDEDDLYPGVFNLTTEQQGLRQQIGRMISGQASVEQIEDFFMMQAIRDSMETSAAISSSSDGPTIATNSNNNTYDDANASKSDVENINNSEEEEEGEGGDARSRIDILQGMNPELLSIEEQLELAIAMSIRESEEEARKEEADEKESDNEKVTDDKGVSNDSEAEVVGKKEYDENQPSANGNDSGVVKKDAHAPVSAPEPIAPVDDDTESQQSSFSDTGAGAIDAADSSRLLLPVATPSVNTASTVSTSDVEVKKTESKPLVKDEVTIRNINENDNFSSNDNDDKNKDNNDDGVDDVVVVEKVPETTVLETDNRKEVGEQKEHEKTLEAPLILPTPAPAPSPAIIPTSLMPPAPVP